VTKARKIQSKDYKPRNNRISAANAARWGARLDELRAQAPDGVVTTRNAVDDAADPTSPLHDACNWDNVHAADRWRVRQMRDVIRNIEVVIIYEDRPQQPVRITAFVNTTPGVPDADQGYLAIEDATTRPDHWERIKEAMLRDIERFQDTYAAYLGFEAVNKAMSNLKTSIKKSPIPPVLRP
jgi:hypothetical protein